MKELTVTEESWAVWREIMLKEQQSQVRNWTVRGIYYISKKKNSRVLHCAQNPKSVFNVNWDKRMPDYVYTYTTYIARYSYINAYLRFTNIAMMNFINLI